jgi:hypothetical protein
VSNSNVLLLHSAALVDYFIYTYIRAHTHTTHSSILHKLLLELRLIPRFNLNSACVLIPTQPQTRTRAHRHARAHPHTSALAHTGTQKHSRAQTRSRKRVRTHNHTSTRAHTHKRNQDTIHEKHTATRNTAKEKYRDIQHTTSHNLV